MRMRLNDWAVLIDVMYAMSGCNKELPRKGETQKTEPASQAASAHGEQTQTGEALFKQYCATCHPDGGNASDPQRTLRGSALKANHIIRPEDIVRIMRHPISRMIKFDETTISDQEARAIAEYVLVTFK